MSQQELLSEVVEALQRLGVPFMLTGSHASSLYGEARSTHDIDLVVALPLQNVPALVAAFGAPRFYLSEMAVREAVQTGRMFNLLETSTGEKVDFWMLTDAPFDQARFARRQRVDLGAFSLDVSSPEDTLLMKLVWSKQAGGSEKQLQDAVRIYELQADSLDFAYLQQWAKMLDVGPLWRRVQDEAEPLQS